MCKTLWFAFLCAGTLSINAADNLPGTPVSVLITLESKGENVATLSRDTLSVRQDKDTRPVTDLRAMKDSPSQILLLFDDSAGGSFDTQLPELKNFITSLPANAEVAIAYMHNGFSQMACEFTPDHAKAANSLRISEGMGGADVSPYDSLSDAVKKWPASDANTRREVIMISSGIEGLGGGLPPDNPYVNAGISSAIKAGVTVYAIYNPGFGHAGHSLWMATSGQNFLSQLTDETGGELYTVGFGSAVSFAPFLADILKRQSEQYVVTFEARAEKKSGLQPVKIRAMAKGISLAAPDKVYVKAGL
jgi:hypothetical protein